MKYSFGSENEQIPTKSLYQWNSPNEFDDWNVSKQKRLISVFTTRSQRSKELAKGLIPDNKRLCDLTEAPKIVAHIYHNERRISFLCRKAFHARKAHFMIFKIISCTQVHFIKKGTDLGSYPKGQFLKIRYISKGVCRILRLRTQLQCLSVKSTSYRWI